MIVSRICRYGVTLSVCGVLGFGAEPSLVYASKWFGEQSPKKIKYIETDKNQILVFEEKMSPYVLDGADLDIDAEVVRVIGNVVIRAYRVDAVAAPSTVIPTAKPQAPGGANGGCNRSGCGGGNGDTGEVGKEGEKGAKAGKVKLKIKSLVGDGSLTIVSSGGKGGKGGVGGIGGQGGNGGRGSDPSCGDYLGRDRDGARPGGDGGSGGGGGEGGKAGDGGDAGPIDYSRDVKPLIAAGKVKLDAAGGPFGEKGEGGYGGHKGIGGGGGDSKGCGAQGTMPGERRGNDGTGHDTERGPQGKGGSNGRDGSITCYNCGN